MNRVKGYYYYHPTYETCNYLSTATVSSAAAATTTTTTTTATVHTRIGLLSNRDFGCECGDASTAARDAISLEESVAVISTGHDNRER